MKRIFNRALLVALALALVVAMLLWRRAARLEQERDRYRGNTEALLADIRRIRVDSTTMAVDVNTLRLTVEEYKRLRAEDAEKIKRMGVKIKNLEAAARHEVEVADGRLRGEIRVPVTLRQAVWVEYKGWWFWRRVKAVHQTIASDNPYAEVTYSEYIEIGKRR